MFGNGFFIRIEFIATIKFLELVFDRLHLLTKNIFSLVLVDRFADLLLNIKLDLGIEVEAVKILRQKTEFFNDVLFFEQELLRDFIHA